MRAELAYNAGMQPSEIGRLTVPEAQALLRKVSEMKNRDRMESFEQTKLLVESNMAVVKAVHQLGNIMVRAFR